MFKAGDKVVCVKISKDTSIVDFEIGKIYTIYESEPGGLACLPNNIDHNHSNVENFFYYLSHRYTTAFFKEHFTTLKNYRKLKLKKLQNV